MRKECISLGIYEIIFSEYFIMDPSNNKMEINDEQAMRIKKSNADLKNQRKD
jgi:hypothetical protein